MSAQDPAPKGRVDARRNRERLLDVARERFAAGEGSVSLEGIARAAGVGIGTLYRHFPTREALAEAVYRSELDEVCASAAALQATMAPAEALRAWMDRYADFVVAKRGMADMLRAMVTSGAIAPGQTRARVDEVVGALLAAGASAGTLRGDVLADDVVATLLGIFMATPGPESRPQVDRMLDLLVAGLRAAPRSR